MLFPIFLIIRQKPMMIIFDNYMLLNQMHFSSLKLKICKCKKKVKVLVAQ